MTRSRLWTAGTVAVVLVVLLVAWLMLIGPKRSEAAELRERADDVAAQNVKTQAQIEQLEADQKDLPAQIAKIATIQAQIPNDPRLPALIQQLVGASRAHGASITAVSPGVPTELAGVDGVRYIPVEITADGHYHGLTKFLAQLEPRDADLKDRAFLVTGMTVKEADPADQGSADAAAKKDPDALTLVLQARVFLSADVTAPVGGTTGAKTSAKSSSSSGSSSSTAN